MGVDREELREAAAGFKQAVQKNLGAGQSMESAEFTQSGHNWFLHFELWEQNSEKTEYHLNISDRYGNRENNGLPELTRHESRALSNVALVVVGLNLLTLSAAVVFLVQAAEFFVFVLSFLSLLTTLHLRKLAKKAEGDE